jgi:hypothetical protein
MAVPLAAVCSESESSQLQQKMEASNRLCETNTKDLTVQLSTDRQKHEKAVENLRKTRDSTEEQLSAANRVRKCESTPDCTHVRACVGTQCV